MNLDRLKSEVEGDLLSYGRDAVHAKYTIIIARERCKRIEASMYARSAVYWFACNSCLQSEWHNSLRRELKYTVMLDIAKNVPESQIIAQYPNLM